MLARYAARRRLDRYAGVAFTHGLTHIFALDAVDEALRTVGGEGQGDAIHCAVDPWR